MPKKIYKKTDKGMEQVGILPSLTEWDGKVNKSGDTMTGSLSVAGSVTSPYIATGDTTSSYFQSRKFRGEGNAATYYHAVDFGFAGQLTVMYKLGKTAHTVATLFHFRTISIKNPVFKVCTRNIRRLNDQ